MKNFHINFLDHVAIRTKDIDKSVTWYEKILGLKKYTFEEWGEFPVFMMSGKTGVAIFPAKDDEKYQKIDHFAFNVSNEDFEKAKQYFTEIDEPYEIQNHHFFISLYLKDPDDYRVELTTLVVKEEKFY